MRYLGGLVLWEEAVPQFYRKIGLNGRLLCDTEPFLHKRTDAEPEQTSVDALTLQLRHQTTDVYVPLVGSDFALQVRRNHVASVWASGAGLASNRRPDLPFGGGWLSGLAANVHIIDRGPEYSVHVLVTDDEGTFHRFIEFFQGGGHAGYYPLPNGHAVQDGRAMTLRRQGEFLEFRRKYGTTLTFDLSAPVVEKAGGPSGSEEHRYYRARRVNDRRGGYMEYHFHADNPGIIPDEISFAKRNMILQRNAQGVIERIVDLRGYEQRYEYRPSRFQDGSPLLVRQYRAKMEDKIPCTLYEYDEASQSVGQGVEERHVALSLIADPLGNTYLFKHQHHFSSWKTETPTGYQIPPIRLAEISLPDRQGVTKFHDYSPPCTEGQPSAGRTTFVSDAERHGQLYEFTGMEEITLRDLPWSRIENQTKVRTHAPRLWVWRRQQVTYFQGDRHRYDAGNGKFSPDLFTRILLRETYEFDLGAGAALAKAIDTGGHVTSFTYGDALLRPQLEKLLPQGFQDPLAERSMDVTESTNPLGGIKRFAYASESRALIRKEDELGHLTVYEVDARTGLPKVETVYVNAKAEQEGSPFARTEYDYGHPVFPGFLTGRKILNVKTAFESPAWAVDLVRQYEADEYGCIAREIADPAKSHFVWNYLYDQHHNKLSAQYPNGYFVQFRYDGSNRLVRTYRGNGSVKKMSYDARGDQSRVIDPDGDITINRRDEFCRIISVEQITGPVDKRQKKLTTYRYNKVNSTLREKLPGEQEKKRKFDGVQRVIHYNPSLGKFTNYFYSGNGCSNLFRSSRFCCAGYDSKETRRWYCLYDGMQNLLRQSPGIIRAFASLSKKGARHDYTYDVAGNRLQERDGYKVTSYEYDALNRLVITRYPNGSWSQVLRTSTGLEYGSFDSSGKRTEKVFDGAGFEVTE